ncbi:hypothetical protein HZA33_05080 [Candidatus Pacearchaeota archaeon]|nr:hypothetical protein [Candidatus Pacearchaeota archaeon]
MAKSDIAYIILFSLILGYILAFPLSMADPWSKWAVYAGFAFILLAANLIAKKLSAYVLDCYVDLEPWNWQRYWLYESAYWRRPVPMWLIWPIALVWVTLGAVKWLAITTFEVVPLASKVRRRFSELTEWDIAVIAATGIAANLVLAVLAAFLGYPEFAKIAMLFIFFNMLPLPAYDGGKILFGSKLFFSFIFIITIINTILIYLQNTLTTWISFGLLILILIVIFFSLRER